MNGLPGYYLRMAILASSKQCKNIGKFACKDKLEKNLQALFHDLSTRTIAIQLEENSRTILTIKLCNLREIEGKAMK